MVRFIDEHRETYGVESICAQQPIAPSTYFLWKAQQQDPTTRSARIAAPPGWRIWSSASSQRRGRISWVADFTYVATSRGFVYVAFVIDVFARSIVGWRVSASLATDFVL